MIKKNRRQSKYFAPQNDNKHHICDHAGCNRAGEYRAPKDRNLKEYYWFCLEHVQEYNARWNYYSDDDFIEHEDNLRKKFRFSSHIKYNFGFDHGYDFFDEYSPKGRTKPNVNLTIEERKALQIMNIDFGSLDVDTLKKSYKKAVKKYHPDVNNVDPTAEENFKIISIAYKSLLKKLSC